MIFPRLFLIELVTASFILCPSDKRNRRGVWGITSQSGACRVVYAKPQTPSQHLTNGGRRVRKIHLHGSRFCVIHDFLIFVLFIAGILLRILLRIFIWKLGSLKKTQALINMLKGCHSFMISPASLEQQAEWPSHSESVRPVWFFFLVNWEILEIPFLSWMNEQF